MPTILSETYEQSILCFLRRFKLLPLIVSFFLVVFSIFFVRDLAHRSVIGAQKRELPYPGLLPNHPLYPLKQLRDEFMLMTTRAPLQKAQLYLHLADKTVNAANMLTDCSLSVKTALHSQAYLLDQQEVLQEAKEMGLAPEVAVIEGNKLSMREHARILKGIHKRCNGTEDQKVIAQAQRLHDSFSRWFLATYPTL